MNVDFLALVKSGFLPGWGIFALLLVAIIRTRPANKVADEATAAAQYKRLLEWSEKMEERVKVLEDQLKKVTGERDEALARALKAEAIQLGMGIGRQRAAD